MSVQKFNLLFFFFNDTATTEIYTLSLHDALPICLSKLRRIALPTMPRWPATKTLDFPTDRPSAPESLRLSTHDARDRKSTRLNSSHSQISYAVFCLKKKKIQAHFLSLHRFKSYLH